MMAPLQALVMVNGYVLSFKDDSGIERVVEFAGRGLRPNEQKFGISEIECLAVLSGIQYLSPFLQTTNVC